MVSFELLEMFFLCYVVGCLRLNDTVSIAVAERCQRAKSVFMCLGAQSVELPSLELDCSVRVLWEREEIPPRSYHLRDSWNKLNLLFCNELFYFFVKISVDFSASRN